MSLGQAGACEALTAINRDGLSKIGNAIAAASLRHQQDERRKVMENVDQDRRHAIDAAIVRTMKSRKVLQHQQVCPDTRLMLLSLRHQAVLNQLMLHVDLRMHTVACCAELRVGCISPTVQTSRIDT